MTLIHADCFDAMPRIETGSVDFILADLPFGTTGCDWDNPALRHERRQSAAAPGAIDLNRLWCEYARLLKPNGAIALFSSQRFTALLIASNYPNFAYTWSWDKKFAANFAQAKRMPLLVCEEITIFSTTGKLPRYFPMMTDRDKPIKAGSNSQRGKAIQIQDTDRAREYAAAKTVYTTKNPTNLLPFNCREERGLHPTQKPVSLCKYLIQTYTAPNEVVLDNCMGSGTTGVAAIGTGRRFIGIEREREYFDVATRRLSLVPPEEYVWPAGCHSPNSCHRNGRCMYVGCKHDGKDITALAALALTSTDRRCGFCDGPLPCLTHSQSDKSGAA